MVTIKRDHAFGDSTAFTLPTGPPEDAQSPRPIAIRVSIRSVAVQLRHKPGRRDLCPSPPMLLPRPTSLPSDVPGTRHAVEPSPIEAWDALERHGQSLHRLLGAQEPTQTGPGYGLGSCAAVPGLLFRVTTGRHIKTKPEGRYLSPSGYRHRKTLCVHEEILCTKHCACQALFFVHQTFEPSILHIVSNNT